MNRSRLGTVLLAISWGFTLPTPAPARVFVADPSAKSGEPGYYRSLVGTLAPGDTLRLPPGSYPNRLNLDGVKGSPSAWVVIEGPASGPPAVITTESDCCNTVQLGGTAYLALRNLTIDSAGLDAIDGINAKGRPTHDILIEGCTLVGQGSHQGTVAISTKSPAWRWTIRRNRILEAGTGLYLGNSDGTQPFIAGIVEGNLIVNSIGYNMQIKHQVPYASQPWISELPPGPHRTLIRNNVFIKEKNDWPPSKVEAPRPNLLVDPFPESGDGSSDCYEIYGNFFYRNPNEALLQATGRVSVHDNIFVGSGAGQSSANFTDHNGPLRVVHVYNNTVYSVSGGGIQFTSTAREAAEVSGNLIITGGTGLGGPISNSKDNVLAPAGDASHYFVGASEVLGQMDFYPKLDCSGCAGSPLAKASLAADADYDRDFNGTPKGGFAFRGAYAGAGKNPGWKLQQDFKVGGPARSDSLTAVRP